MISFRKQSSIKQEIKIETPAEDFVLKMESDTNEETPVIKKEIKIESDSESFRIKEESDSPKVKLEMQSD